MTPAVEAEVTPDVAMIRVFSDIVFGGLDGLVAVRLLKKPEDKAWTETYRADAALPAALARDADRAARSRRGLYVIPATLKRGWRATQDNLAATIVLPVDLDGGDIETKAAFLSEALGPPTLTVASGGLTDEGQRKLHLYWRLGEPAAGADMDRVKRLRADLARKAGGDPSFDRMTQPIRVAGSLHCKTETAVLATIVDQSERTIDLSAAAERIDAMPARFAVDDEHAPERMATARAPISQLKEKRVRAGALDGVTRFDALSSVIGHWVRRARLGEITDGEAWAAVRDHNATMIVPPWDETRLRREFEAIRDRDRLANPPVRITARAASEGEAPEPADLSEDALAAEFVDAHGDDWRHVAAMRRWIRWSGDRWRPDETRAVFDAVRGVCRVASRSCENPREARRIASRKTIEAVERIAAGDARIALGADAFDADPMLLNTPAGVLDLETGVIEPNRREHLLTRCTSVAPSGDCRIWTAFIDQVSGGDAALAVYLQRVAGYCLTGSTSEQVFFFLHGHGANGKSVFLNTLAAALGDYAKTAPFETFAASRYAGHPTDLASLQGARLVTVAETAPDRSWAESRIKTITGGDPISARVMRADFFEYRPVCKLLFAGNYRPALKGVGEAMKRRLHLVPFAVTIPSERRDRHLEGRLRGELGGILSWMIDGCSAWRERGLDPPKAVKDAAEEYFSDEDLVGQWIAACCVTSPEHRVSSDALFASWSAFAEAGGYERGTLRSLANELKARGFHQTRNARARGWIGLTLARRRDNA